MSVEAPHLSVVPPPAPGAAPRVEKYPFDPGFEKAVVHFCTFDSRFFGRIGVELEPPAFSDPVSQVVMKLAHDIFKDLSKGPESPIQILQRIRRQVDDGKAVIEDITRVSDFLEDCSQAARGMTSATVLEELTPMIRRRLERRAMTEGTTVFAKKGDLGAVADLIQRARRVGLVDATGGVRLGPASFGRIEKLRQIQRLPIGIPELDVELNGGLVRGGVAVIASDTGGGKTMTMNQWVGHALSHGLNVAVASLELPEEEWEARVIANRTGCSIDAIMQGGVDAESSQERLVEMLPRLGVLTTKFFSPQATTFETIKDWVRTEALAIGAPIDLLVIDYAEKLKGRSMKDKRQKDEKRDPMEEVFEDMRHFTYVDKEVGWIVTASQVKNRNARKHTRVEADDLAGSSEKARSSSLVVVVSKTSEGDAYEFYVAKHTQGKSRFKVGPFPHDETCGRIYAAIHPL